MNKLNKRIFMGMAALFAAFPVFAQVTGGQDAFPFLNLSTSPHISALGEMVPAGVMDDISFTLQNPALLNPKTHNQLALNYNFYYDHIGIANFQYGYHVVPLKTDFAVGVQYLDYGTFDGADIYGNPTGEVKAADYSVNLSASRKYLNHWRNGATMKFGHSMLADRQASALLFDVGILYEDTSSLWSFGLVAKNMGFMMKNYNPDLPSEPLPFDLQLGISKQLKNVPIRIFLVGHNLYEWNIRYDNPADIKPNNIFGTADSASDGGSHFADKLMRHINIGASITIAKRLEIDFGYNHLHRSELGAGDAQGLAGFSFGGNLNLNKLRIQFAHSYISTAGAYNQIGLILQLNKLFGIGKKSDKLGWNKSY